MNYLYNKCGDNFLNRKKNKFEFILNNLQSIKQNFRNEWKKQYKIKN